MELPRLLTFLIRAKCWEVGGGREIFFIPGQRGSARRELFIVRRAPHRSAIWGNGTLACRAKPASAFLDPQGPR